MPADKKRPSGREFRSGTLGDALDDVYAEFEKIAPGTAVAALVNNGGGEAANGTIAVINNAGDAADAITELAVKIEEIRAVLVAAGICS